MIERIRKSIAGAWCAVRARVLGRKEQPKRASGVVLQCLRRLWLDGARYSPAELAGGVGRPLVTVAGALRYCGRAGYAVRGEDGRWRITALGRRRLELGGGRQRVRRAELAGKVGAVEP